MGELNLELLRINQQMDFLTRRIRRAVYGFTISLTALLLLIIALLAGMIWGR